MKELYIEVFSDVELDGTCIVPIETVIALFVYKYCENPPALVTFVLSSRSKTRPCFKVKISKILFEFINEDEIEPPADLCNLPVIVTNEGTTVVAGLCAVLRHVLKISDPRHPLLGFKQSCLYACAESSIWTKFCEIDVIKTVNELFSEGEAGVFEDVARFETHMGQPVRIHNIQKLKQDYAKAKGLEVSRLPDSRLDLLEDLEHVYAEGPEMSLADVILFPCFHLMLRLIGSVRQRLPLTFKWHEIMLENEHIAEAVKIILENPKEIYMDCNLPNVPNQSLYKSEKKTKPKRQYYTQQDEIDGCFEIIQEMKLPLIWESSTFGHDVDFDWSNLPFEGSQLPEKRLDRKRQQLENMAKAVLKIAKQNDQIVDFCSGSGHLGLILAHSLPRCTVILLENKEESLNRARERAFKLKLSNLIFCQSNIDYFRGSFNIGVSLHACGVATDLVMEICIRQKAAFVCCPCCYGSIQPNHMVSYPRSTAFSNSRLTLKEYFVLGHSADQTHDENNVKTSQGNKCMGIIDMDRCSRAKEIGYRVYLSKLDPVSCTPKNNLLVGIPS